MADQVAFSEDEAYRLSRDWHVIDGEDATEVNGVSLGSAMQRAVFEYLFPAASTLSEHIGWRSTLEKLAIAWPARFWAGRLRAAWSPEPPQSRIALLYDSANRPSIANTNAVARALSTRGCSALGLVVDPRVERSVEPVLPRVMFAHAVDAALVARSLSQLRRHLRGFERALTQLDIAIRARGPAPPSWFATKLRIRAGLHQCVLEAEALRVLLRRVRCERLLLASDALRGGRLATQVARQQGCETLVLQHGAPIWRYGYVPLHADRIAVWGEQSRQWFRDHGVPDRRIIVTGCPRYDDVTLALSFPDTLPTPSRLVLLTNYVDHAVTARAVAAVLDSPIEAERIIKLHPQQRDEARFRSLARGRAQVLRREPIEEVIRPGDLAVVGNSTAGIDAAMLGAFIVNYEVAGWPNPIPYARYDVGVTVPLHDLEEGLKVAATRRAHLSPDHFRSLSRFLRDTIGVEPLGSTRRARDAVVALLLDAQQ